MVCKYTFSSNLFKNTTVMSYIKASVSCIIPMVLHHGATDNIDMFLAVILKIEQNNTVIRCFKPFSSDRWPQIKSITRW